MLKEIRKQVSDIRKEEVASTVSRQHLDKVLAWHTQAKEQKVNWRKLEQQFLSDIQPTKEKVLFKDGSKLLRHLQGKTYTVITCGTLNRPTIQELLTDIKNTVCKFD